MLITLKNDSLFVIKIFVAVCIITTNIYKL